MLLVLMARLTLHLETLSLKTLHVVGTEELDAMIADAVQRTTRNVYAQD